MGPGARAVLSVVMPPATAAVQPTTRQRGPGGAPVGNSSGTRLSKRTNAGTKAQVPNQATKSDAAGASARPNAMCQKTPFDRTARVHMSAPTATIHPMGLRGRLAATTAPTTAKVENTIAVSTAYGT